MTPSIVQLDFGWSPTANYPRPVLIQNGARAVLYFTGRRSGGLEERVVGLFSGVLVTRFGYPNDEALAGHPLYGNGLQYYRVQEVVPSPWMCEVQERNRVAFPNFDMPLRRHFVVTLHDHSFECLAMSIDIKLATEIRPEDLIAGFSEVDRCSCLTSRYSQRLFLSRPVLAHVSRQKKPWLSIER